MSLPHCGSSVYFGDAEPEFLLSISEFPFPIVADNTARRCSRGQHAEHVVPIRYRSRRDERKNSRNRKEIKNGYGKPATEPLLQPDRR
jgi:hypothetical protein